MIAITAKSESNINENSRPSQNAQHAYINEKVVYLRLRPKVPHPPINLILRPLILILPPNLSECSPCLSFWWHKLTRVLFHTPRLEGDMYIYDRKKAYIAEFAALRSVAVCAVELRAAGYADGEVFVLHF